MHFVELAKSGDRNCSIYSNYLQWDGIMHDIIMKFGTNAKDSGMLMAFSHLESFSFYSRSVRKKWSP